MISCNILAFRPELFITQLKSVDKYFDRIRVLNSNPSDGRVKECLDRFSNIEYHEKEFTNMSVEFQYLLSKSEIGEWWMYLSDDEIPSIPMLENLYDDIDKCLENKGNCIWYPFINVRDYKPFWDATDKMEVMYGFLDGNVGEEFGIKPQFQWSAVRMFLNNGRIRFKGTAHNIISGIEGSMVSANPIFHYKTFDSWISSCLWQAIVHEESTWWVDEPKIRIELLSALKDSGIEHNSYSIVAHLKSGKISQSLKDWIWKYKYHSYAYIFAWFIYYYLRCHPEELSEEMWNEIWSCDDGMRLINEWQNHVMGNYSKLETINSRFHPLVKKMFLKRGLVTLTKVKTQ